MNLILVRHGQTDWNLKGKIQSFSDIPLNEEGRRQAEILSYKLKDKKIDAIYCSTLMRAKETAYIIAKPHGITPVCLSFFNEANQGLWEGLREEEVMNRFSQERELFFQDPFKYPPPKGESFTEVKRRAKEGLREIFSKYPTHNVLLVGHQLLNAIIKSFLEHTPFTFSSLPENARVDILKVCDAEIR